MVPDATELFMQLEAQDEEIHRPAQLEENKSSGMVIENTMFENEAESSSSRGSEWFFDSEGSLHWRQLY